MELATLSFFVVKEGVNNNFVNDEEEFTSRESARFTWV